MMILEIPFLIDRLQGKEMFATTWKKIKPCYKIIQSNLMTTVSVYL